MRNIFLKNIIYIQNIKIRFSFVTEADPVGLKINVSQSKLIRIHTKKVVKNHINDIIAELVEDAETFCNLVLIILTMEALARVWCME